MSDDLIEGAGVSDNMVKYPNASKLIEAEAYNSGIGGKPLRAAFFGYSWRQGGALNAYLSESVAAILGLGIDVDVYLANYFVARRGVQGFSHSLSRHRLSSYIRSRNYDFAISFNNALVMPDVVDALSCRIVSVLVDSEQHLFDHLELGGFNAFKFDIAIAPIFSSLQEDVEKLLPSAMARFYFIPPATSKPLRRHVKEPLISVSWIASLVGDEELDRFARHIIHNKKDAIVASRCLEQVEATGYLDYLRNSPETNDLAARLNWDIELLEVHVQNIVTNSRRLSAVKKLSNRGLHLYGNSRWSTLIPSSPEVARSFMAGEEIISHSQQMDIYNGSRISINIPQIQAKTGLQFRILDIMASNALLITSHVPQSDLGKVFGETHPVPTFNDEEEMVKLVDHFLHHDEERINIVRECNKMLEDGFSFTERALDYLRISNPGLVKQLEESVSRNQGSKAGQLSRVSHERFTNWTGLR